MPKVRSLTNLILFLSVISFIGFTAATAIAQDIPRVLSARDTVRVNVVGAPRLSPDGQWVLYTLTSRDMQDEDLASTTHVWRVRVDGSDNHQLTRGDKDARSPTWSPDGQTIAFLSERGEAPDAKTQVHFIRADGGEAWQVTDHLESVGGFLFSPDGGKLLFMAQDGLPDDKQKKHDRKDDAEVLDQEFQMVHLWSHDLHSDESVRLTEGMFTGSSPAWSPDSRWVAYERRPTPTANDGWRSDIWLIEVETGTTRPLYENAGSDTSPKWSPDGRTVAYASNPVVGDNTTHNNLHLVSPDGGVPRVLVDDIDRDFSSPIWSVDGRRVYWSVGSGTSTELLSVSVESGATLSETAPGGRNSAWELSKDGSRWVWVHTSAGWPAEIYTSTRDGGEATRLTDANAWLRDEGVKLGAVRTVRWENSDGQPVEGVLTLPVGYQVGESYPFIVNPHGGPTGASLEAFSAAAQFFAGNGYVVLQPNFRGSTNYGQAFVNANIDNWGITDYDDVMTGVDFAIEQGWADPERLVCYGWSYGGYLSAWIVTQTDRFKAVSPGAALTNLFSMYSTNDIQDYLASFFGGTPWAATQNYRDHSPITYADQVTSPVLVMHGASDTRVPPEQSVEFYRALRDLGKDVTFVRFPREGHGFTETRHIIDRLRRYAVFFGEHIGNPPISEQQDEASEAPLEESENR